MVTTPTVDAVEKGYHGNPVQTDDLSSTGQSPPFDGIDDDQLGEAELGIKEAVSLIENVFSDSVLFTSELKDGDNAAKIMSRHKWAVVLGEAQSEGQGGANVTWSLPDGSEIQLAPTRYAKELQAYTTREVPNVGVFRTSD